MKKLNRRDFMSGMGKIAAGALALPALSYEKVLGANGGFVAVAVEKGELKFAPVSDELLQQLGKKREPDWLRCPLFFTRDSHRPELRNRKAGDIAAMVRQIAENNGKVFRLGICCYGDAFYQSKVTQHAPGLGDIDYLREALDEGEKCGVKILAYINPNGLYDDHPLYEQCVLRDAKGQIWNVWGYGETRTRYPCINNPVYKKLLVDVLTEMFTQYDPAGLYVDGLTPHICFCPYCKAKYKQMFNEEMPAKFESWNQTTVFWEMVSMPELVGDPRDPDSKKLTEFFYSSLIDMTKTFTETVKNCKPDVVSIYHSWPKPDITQYYDGTLSEIYVRAPWVHTLWKDGELANYAALMGMPILQNVYLQHRTDAEARHKMVSALANGVYPNAWNFRGMKTVFGFIADNAEYFDYATTAPVKFLAFPRVIRHDSIHRKIVKEKVLSSSPRDQFLAPYVGLYSALLRAGVPVVTLHRLNFHEKFKDYKVLCLANEVSLTDEQIEAIRKFVAAGGGLVATYQTSLFDEQARLRPDFALADVFGTSYQNVVAGNSQNEVRFTDKHPVTSGLEGAKIIYDEPQIAVKPSGGQVVAKMYGADIDPNGLPAVIVNNYASGKVVYLPGRLDSLQCEKLSPLIEKLFANSVQWVSNNKMPVETEAPATIGVTVFDQPQRRILHLVNHNADTIRAYQSIEPIENISLRLETPKGKTVAKLHRLWNKADVPFELEGNIIKFKLPEIGEYEVIAAELK